MESADIHEMLSICERLREVLAPLRSATRDLGSVILTLNSDSQRARFRADWQHLTQLAAEVAQEAADINHVLNCPAINVRAGGSRTRRPTRNKTPPTSRLFMSAQANGAPRGDLAGQRTLAPFWQRGETLPPFVTE